MRERRERRIEEEEIELKKIRKEDYWNPRRRKKRNRGKPGECKNKKSKSKSKERKEEDNETLE